jgi:nucleolar pre-ribosomal-associated protein 1
MQMWSYAAQSNSDPLFSATSAIVALLLKTLSNHIDFRDNGLLLCKTLLQQAQLRLLSRGMASPKNREFLISPCLRVLTEVVTFDGGILARSLYSKRDMTIDMQTLGRNLTLRKAPSEDPEDNIRKPSVRTNAVKYLLANFKFQNEAAKMDILKQANVMRALMEGIEQDPSQVIADIVSCLRLYVVRDQAILRRSKAFAFSDRNLYNLCQLYRIALPDIPVSESQKPLKDQVHALMVDICSSPDVGVVRPFGWYPPSPDDSDAQETLNAKAEIDLGLDSLEWYGKFTNGVPIKNRTLGEFILHLRPHAYEMERQLLMAIFEAAPELVAYYFYKITPTFSFAPKLTSTWIGYASFIFSTTQLPVPKLYNRLKHLPPPIGVVIENVIPQPLNQKILRQCISGGSSDLVEFFAVRILTVALQKLGAVLNLFHENAKTRGILWEQACDKLVAEFTRRCLPIRDITTAYSALRSSAKDNLTQREAITRLMSLYYEVTTQTALDQKYDISAALAESLQHLEVSSESGNDKELRLLELGHLVKIANWSPSMNWWNKAKAHKFSPFLSLLRLVVKSETEPEYIKLLLRSISRNSYALQTESKLSGLDSLIVSLKEMGNFEPTEAVFEFVDDCFHTFAIKPIKYEDDKDAVVHGPILKGVQNGPISLIWMTVLEQWHFVEKTRRDSMSIIAEWIARFHSSLLAAGESSGVLTASQVRLETSNTNNILTIALSNLAGEEADRLSKYLHQYSGVTYSEDALMVDGGLEGPLSETANGDVQDRTNGSPDQSVLDASALNISSFNPPPVDHKNKALTLWTRKDISTIVDDGALSSLINLLSSPIPSIRLQTMAALRTLAANIQSSTYIEKDQLYLLIAELLETATPIIENGNIFPALAATWAARAVGVMSDPTHVLYEKINEYLNLGPSWWLGKMTGYWTDQVLLHPPTDEAEGSYFRELIWLLEWLEDGIRSVDDVEPLRRNGVFEKLCSLFCHDALDGYGASGGKVVEMFLDREALEHGNSLQGKIRPLILRVLARAVAVGGADTLVTRTGVLAWLGIVKGKGWLGGVEGDRVIEQLESAILGLCQGDRVKEWSAGLLQPKRVDIVVPVVKN